MKTITVSVANINSKLIVNLPHSFGNPGPMRVELSDRKITLTPDQTGLRGSSPKSNLYAHKFEAGKVRGRARLEKFGTSTMEANVHDSGVIVVNLLERGSMRPVTRKSKGGKLRSKKALNEKLPIQVLIETGPNDSKRLRVTMMEAVDILAKYSHRVVE